MMTSKIECSECSAEYRVPDQLNLIGKKVRATCKRCSNVIEVFFSPKDQPEKTWKDLLPPGIQYGDQLREKVTGNLKKLYPMPHVALKARQLILNDDFDFEQMGKLLKTDPALAGRILKVANSAYFGLSGQVSSIRHAAALLGTRLMVQIINMVSHSKLLGGNLPGYQMDSGAMWRHTLTVAVGSDFIAKKIAPKFSGEAFLAGLLHDTGKIILDATILERQAAFRSLLKEPDQTIVSAEQNILEFNHATISGDLCNQWGLPDYVTDAVSHHHHPSQSRANILAYIVHAADNIADISDVTDLRVECEKLDTNVLSFLQIDASKLQSYAHQILESVETLEDDTY